MRIKQTIFFLLVCFSSLTIHAQNTDLADTFQLEEIVVAGTRMPVTGVVAAPSVSIASEEINLHMGHSLMDALSHTEGVQAMDIGVGFSKPMIRGLGFQRVVVSENGVKQEGQQWGADHGLEIDAFNVEGVTVVKGPASVLYGSDAMGGAIEIHPPIIPMEDTLSGEIILQHQSVSSGLSGSAKLAIKRKRFYTQIRYTERHWGDYRVPADSFTYLSMRLPINDRHLKNTAGKERSANCLLAFRNKHYEGRLNISDNYQKSGFFSGAHGIPVVSNMESDGDKWNIDLPYSMVNHFKISNTNKWTTEKTQTMFVLGFQQNHREEWSKFHTHTIGQQPPAVDPDKELMLNLQTVSAKLQFRYRTTDEMWEHYIGVSSTFQENGIGGYGFLIPEYRRREYGAYYLMNCKANDKWSFNASGRYDIGHIHTDAHGNDVGEVVRDFNDYSLAIGAVFTPKDGHEWRGSIGRAFRLPSANELTSNGVHHGAFRHELGDSSLVGEQGWQADLSYSLRKKVVELSLSPFFSYYPHYISLHPTGQWSMLPDAGQIYQYIDAPATFFGGEARMKVKIVRDLFYQFSGEYVHTYDHNSRTATPFSPPASMRNTISWERKRWQVYTELHSVATQNRVCHNEDATPGYNLLNVGGKVEFAFSSRKLSLNVNARNVLNSFYLNHLNFYRKIDLPEAGVDIQSTIRFTF